jgi:hypothetical protein
MASKRLDKMAYFHPLVSSNLQKHHVAEFFVNRPNPLQRQFPAGRGHPALVVPFQGHDRSQFSGHRGRLVSHANRRFPLINPASLGEDASGELYIADIGSGED